MERRMSDFGIRFLPMERFPGNPITRLDEHCREAGLPEMSIRLEAQASGRDIAGIEAIRGSNAGDALECPRKVAYAILGAEPDLSLPATSLRTFRTGNMEHAALRNDFLWAGVPLLDVEKEGRCSLGGLEEIREGPKAGMSYHIDGRSSMNLQELGAPGEAPYVFDIKTATKYKIDAAKKLDPDPRAIAQVNAYAWAEDLEYAGIIWQAKEKQWLYGLMFQRNWRLFEAVVSGFLFAWRCVKESGMNLLERGFRPSPRTKDLPWQCGYCAYARRCWAPCGVSQKGREENKLSVKHDGPIPEHAS